MWNYFNGDNDRNDTDDDEEDSLTNEQIAELQSDTDEEPQPDPYELL
jgi:hypothetical protein